MQSLFSGYAMMYTAAQWSPSVAIARQTQHSKPMIPAQHRATQSRQSSSTAIDLTAWHPGHRGGGGGTQGNPLTTHRGMPTILPHPIFKAFGKGETE